MIKVLFVGNFLSKSKGTLGVSEQIASSLPKEYFKILLTSKKQNQILRLLEISWVCFFSSYHKIQIDTYSGKAFIIAEVASFISDLRGIKPIITLHGGMLPEFYQQNKRRVNRVFNRASNIQTPSLYIKDFFFKQGILINYLPNPIKLKNFPFNRDNIKAHSLLWVRAFTHIYNPTLAVKILYEVRKSEPDATLTMIGPDDGLLFNTMNIINKLHLKEFVQIVGPVKNDQLYKYYQTHEVFLNTTSYESFGVAVVEAASCGIPVVSTNVGEIPFLWQHGENMLLIDGFDEIAFSNEVLKLFSQKELSNKLSQNARNKAETFDWNLIKPSWIKNLNLQL